MNVSPSIKIKAEIMWAFLHKKNEMADRYTVDLCQLSPKAVEALEGMGITVNFKEEKGHFITCKSTTPLRTFDDGGTEILGDTLVGNGSKCQALVGSYEWSYKGKKGISPSCKKIVITELVEYVGGIEAVDMEDAL